MKQEDIKVRIILTVVSFATCIIGLVYCILAFENSSWLPVPWVFVFLSVLNSFLLFALIRLQKNNRQ